MLDFIADKFVTRNTSKCYNFWLSCDKSFADNKRKYSLAEIDNNQLAAIARRRDVLEKLILLLLIKLEKVITLNSLPTGNGLQDNLDNFDFDKEQEESEVPYHSPYGRERAKRAWNKVEINSFDIIAFIDYKDNIYFD